MMHSPIHFKSSPPKHAAGFNLIELLVVISVIAILAGILFPLGNSLRNSAKRANCGDNQRMIVMDMLAYTQNNSGRWPRMFYDGSRFKYPFSTTQDGDLDNISVTPAADAGIDTVADTFRFLMSDQVAGTVGIKTFFCPALDKKLKQAVTGTPSEVVVSYAYDYGVMPSSGSDRVVLADRPQGAGGARADQNTSSTHGKRVVVVTADGHVSDFNLKSEKGSDSITSEVYLTSGTVATAPAEDAKVADNPATNDANIFDNKWDDTKQASGSRNRAWLR